MKRYSLPAVIFFSLGIILVVLLIPTIFRQAPLEEILPRNLHVLSSIGISSQDTQIIMERRGSSWKMVFPLYADVDNTQIANLLSALKRGHMEKTSVASATLYSLYGLGDDNSTRVDLRNSTGETFSFTIGESSKSAFLYILTPRSPHVYRSTLPRELIHSFSFKTLLDTSLLPKLDTPVSIDIRKQEEVSRLEPLASFPSSGEEWTNTLAYGLLSGLSMETIHTGSMGAPYPEELRTAHDYKLYYRYSDGQTFTLYVAREDGITYVYKEGQEHIGTLGDDYHMLLGLLF